MMRFFSDVRLVPVVLVAAVALFVLKFTGLVTEGSYTLGAGHLSKTDRVAHEAQLAQELAKSAASRSAASSSSNPPASKQAVAEALKQTWTKEPFNYPDVTGSVPSKPKEPKEAEKKDGDKKEEPKKDEAKPAEKKDAPKADEKPAEKKEEPKKDEPKKD